jgi:hypothetical protein
VLLSLYVPVAVNCFVVPLAIEGLTGVTAIDTSVAAVTVNVTGGLTAPDLDTEICVVPVPTPVAKPPPPVIVATVVVPDTQLDTCVRSCVLPSVYVPVAVNCKVAPFAIDGLTGVTAIDTSVAAVTVNVAPGLVTPFSAAVICELPKPTAVARPAELIVATVVVPETHTTCVVRSLVLLSAYVPVAVKGKLSPFGID